MGRRDRPRRRRRVVLAPLALLALLALLGGALETGQAAGGSAVAGATAPATAETQRQIGHAFKTMLALPTVDQGAATLEGFDAAMRTALEDAGQRLTNQDAGPPITETVGGATVVHGDEASVPFTITTHTRALGAAARTSHVHLTAVALRIGGQWQVSWTTMCLLVESAGQLCPPTPAHTAGGTILPAAPGGSLASSGGALSPGLVDPGPLAIAPDGGVLIADHDRDQILEWKAGALTVVAGDGLQGFAGDGGPAVDAELNDPGEIGVGPDGTIYFVDYGNDRVRAVAPDGSIDTVAGDGVVGVGGDVGDAGPATAAPINPTGLAVSRQGTLYISSNSDIRVVAPDGIISTLVRGGPPSGVAVAIGMPGGATTTTAFFPGSLALGADGDLTVFDSSPKLLLAVDPSGQVTQLSQDYATSLSTAPDGSVLVAQHGNGIERVEDTAVTTLPPWRIDVPTFDNYLVAEGIAEASNGTIYVDTELDGFSDVTSFLVVTAGVVRPVTIDTPLTASLPAEGAPGFPAADYPPPVPARGADAALSQCPSLQGVVPFDAAAERAARQLLGLWNIGFSYNLHASDRAWWAGLVASAMGGGRQTVGAVTPASATIYAQPIGAACGSLLVQDSLAVTMEASPYNFSVDHLFLIDRAGLPLVYFAAA